MYFCDFASCLLFYIILFFYKYVYLQIAPYASVIINGIYWERSHPKLLRTANANQLLTSPNEWTQNDLKSGCPTLPHRLLAICDITADKGGCIEIVQHTTSIDHPFVLYNPKTNTSSER